MKSDNTLMPISFTRTFRLKVRAEAYPWLNAAAVEVNEVFNYWLYQFNTKTAKHYFCPVCGIYAHHQRRSNPDQFGYNVGCLEGVDPYEIPNVPTTDGVHHSADRRA